jgi:hypothetical protein
MPFTIEPPTMVSIRKSARAPFDRELHRNLCWPTGKVSFGQKNLLGDPREEEFRGWKALFRVFSGYGVHWSEMQRVIELLPN